MSQSENTQREAADNRKVVIELQDVRRNFQVGD